MRRSEQFSRGPQSSAGILLNRGSASLNRMRRVILAIIAVLVLIEFPVPVGAGDHTFALTAGRKQISIGSGLTYNAWTYDGTVPGPTLRAKQGDNITIRLLNQTSDAHGIEILGAQIAPQHFSGDPTSTVTYSFKAEVPGVFDYHCSAIPVLDHIASGMYGMMIVDPRAGWPAGKAQEATLVQGEFYGAADEHGMVAGDHARMLAAEPDFLVFNGALGRYGTSSPIAIKTGQLVRVFFLNAGPNLSATFHVSGVIFSTVYPDGNPGNALHNVPSLSLAPGQGAVLEFKVNEPGDYRFLDTAGAHSYKGALGVFRADH
jgi:nitrite reductase (NO-forming)